MFQNKPGKQADAVNTVHSEINQLKLKHDKVKVQHDEMKSGLFINFTSMLGFNVTACDQTTQAARGEVSSCTPKE